jgi:hypothetical protein
MHQSRWFDAISAPNTKAARRSEMLYRYKLYWQREFGVQ